ncbi:Uncharacterised protein [Klebsiella pneumoniae]|uniref:Uncharacterized protein n=1 Tax=Klebsiella pneumoniae TaxID=573 RepID=A0A377URB5_KLEPN|nr:Uncharacterised protein [Klebsiella pneumoniae]
MAAGIPPRPREDLDNAVLLDIDKTHRRLHQEVHLLEQRFVVRQQRFDIAQDLPRLLQLAAGRRALRTRKFSARWVSIRQSRTFQPISSVRQRRQRFVVLVALMAFHNDALSFSRSL